MAHLVWQALGDVRHYIEPMCGSAAVLLARPHAPQLETVNDKDCYIANVWRAIQTAPDEVARYADWPVNEADLRARHLWLVRQDAWRERMLTDPDYYDAQIAGWWLWGLSAWIGSGWCSGRSSWGKAFADGRLAHERLPHLGNAGKGVHRKRPHLAHGSMGIHAQRDIYAWMDALSARLRLVRVCCGDWQRVCTPAVLVAGDGMTGVFLDPPYSHTERDSAIYAQEMASAVSVRAWALEAAQRPKIRIVLAGYAGEHDMPEDWQAIPWKAQGGMGNHGEGRARANRHREMLWCSPQCDPVIHQLEMFTSEGRR